MTWSYILNIDRGLQVPHATAAIRTYIQTGAASNYM